MYIIINAVKNLKRNIGRKLILGIILFAVIITTATGIIINSTSNAVIDDYKDRFSSEVNLQLDFEELMTLPMGEPISSPEKDEFLDYADSEYIHHYDMYSTVPIVSETLDFVDDNAGMGTPIGVVPDDIVMPKGYVKGYNDLSKQDQYFANGARTLVEGEMYSALNECIISEQFRDENNIVIGDTISVDSTNSEDPSSHQLKVVGIYEDNSMIGKDDFYKMVYGSTNNEILTSFDTVSQMEMYETSAQLVIKYFLISPDMLELFETEIREKGLPDHYLVSTDSASYDKIVGPVEGLSEVTNMFLWTVLILGIVVVVFLSTLEIRERKYEIGVLRAIGMKKTKIAFGLIVESLVLTSVCLIIGLSIGSLFSQSIADKLLDDQIAIAEENEETLTGEGPILLGGENTDVSDLEPLSDLEVNISANNIIMISSMSLGLALVSSVVGIIYVTRYEPMKILAERN